MWYLTKKVIKNVPFIYDSEKCSLYLHFYNLLQLMENIEHEISV